MVPLFSLRVRADAGIGDISALEEMAELAAAMNHRSILMLPIDETSPGETSPYSALSVFAIDPIYVGFDTLPGVTPAEVERVRRALRKVPLSDRLTIRTARIALLEAAFQHHLLNPQERAAVAEFAARNRYWLDDYALFRALKDRFDLAPWEQWPEDLRMREPRALERARAEFLNLTEKYVYWQFLAHRQWSAARKKANARRVIIGGDIAFSPARDSAEVWANQELFDFERTVGAPPDAFNPEGQRWGLPAPRWERMRADGFALHRRRAAHAAELFDFIRVDHVVGLYRTFSFASTAADRGAFFPADEPAQREQGEAVLRAILEEARSSLVIAEDLGVIPPFVRASLTALGIPGYKVMRWEKMNQDTAAEAFIPPAKYPPLSLATTGTHDTDTLVRWWEGASSVERVRMLRVLGLIPPDSHETNVDFQRMRDGMLGALYASPSRLVLIPIQDLFGWRERINLPGTVGPANWSWRMPIPIEEMVGDPLVKPRLALLHAMATRSGR